jgi:type IV pilus assembly protein PilN
MIRINLIRGKRKKRREFNVGIAFVLVPLIVLAGTLYFHTTVTGRIRTLQQDIVKANADIERLKKEIGEVERFKLRKAELQKKVDIISSLQTDRKGPVKLFEALSAAIPERCWIDRLDIQGDRVSLSGMALNNNTVANFMTALGQTGRFRDVSLGSADQAVAAGVKLVRFNLTFAAVN